MAKRVLRDVIGNWPKVFKKGPGCYEIEARYKDPQLISRMISLSNIPPMILAVILLPQISPKNWGFVIVGTIVGWMVLYRFTRAMLTDLPFLIKRTTRITVTKGEVRWGKFKVAADVDRQFRSERHRKAAADIRRLQKTSDKTAMPTYQFAQEVFVDVGEGWMRQCLVAEIGDDESGEVAHLLATTLRRVDKLSRVEAETVTRQTARVDLD